jgi:tryptophan 2,3-dioxygenase
MSESKQIKPEIADRLNLLEEKFNAMGQDLTSYLDGLLYADYLTYWDYIRLDTLLSLQAPKTPMPDEQIFIIYHQITELYFKLCLLEFEQIAQSEKPSLSFLIQRTLRIARYFENLTSSFDVMVDGMDPKQFLKFRMSLLPASGFQSAQYRMIEIASTDFIHLVAKAKRVDFDGQKEPSLPEMFEFIYWKYGATELATGAKTLTLKQFEEKYSAPLLELAEARKKNNLWQQYLSLSSDDQADTKLIEALRLIDVFVNINWPLAHYKSAVRYLHKNPEDIAATGGTNWQKYLPPRFQKRIFFPSLWSSEELENWGKEWVKTNVFGFR